MLTKLRLFVKEHWMSILVTVFVALGGVCMTLFVHFSDKTPSQDSKASIVFFIGLILFLTAIIVASFKAYKDYREGKAREQREIDRADQEKAREKHEIERDNRDKERYKVEMEAFQRFITMNAPEGGAKVMNASERQKEIEEARKSKKFISQKEVEKRFGL